MDKINTILKESGLDKIELSVYDSYTCGEDDELVIACMMNVVGEGVDTKYFFEKYLTEFSRDHDCYSEYLEIINKNLEDFYVLNKACKALLNVIPGKNYQMRLEVAINFIGAYIRMHDYARSEYNK